VYVKYSYSFGISSTLPMNGRGFGPGGSGNLKGFCRQLRNTDTSSIARREAGIARITGFKVLRGAGRKQLRKWLTMVDGVEERRIKPQSRDIYLTRQI
jgi:hypothetical protein